MTREQVLQLLLRGPIYGNRYTSFVKRLQDAGHWISVSVSSDGRPGFRLRDWMGARDGCAYCGPGLYQRVLSVDAATLDSVVRCDGCQRETTRPPDSM